MRIETHRLIIKKPTVEDLETLVEEVGNPKVSYFLSHVPFPYTLKDAEFWLKITQENPYVFNCYLNSKLMGGIGITPDKNGVYELGYWFGHSYWGQGFGSEVVPCFLDFFLKKDPKIQIKASYLEGNEASAKILIKNGFEVIGSGKRYCLSRKEDVPSIDLVLNREKFGN